MLHAMNGRNLPSVAASPVLLEGTDMVELCMP